MMKRILPCRIISIVLVLCAFWMVQYTSASSAYASAVGLDIDTCAGTTLPPPAYTQKIVVCVVGSLAAAGRAVAVALAGPMLYVLSSAFVFVIAWYGVNVVGGQRQLVQKMVSLIIRFGIAVLVLFYAGSFIDLWINIIIEFLTMINGPYSPWYHVDMMIGKLIGILPGLVISQGLIGIIGASLMSSTAGIFLFMSGFMGLLDLLLFIYNIVFTYIMAIAVIVFMFAISPLVVTTLLFFNTERYFNKWWHIIVSATLVPILMMTFLYYFLKIFNDLIGDIFEILGFSCGGSGVPDNFSSCAAPDFRAYQKLNTPQFAWVMPSDPHMSQELQDVTSSQDMSVPAVQSNVNPLLRRGFNKNNMDTPAVDFGPNHVAIVEQLFFAFLTLWIFAALFKSIIGKIPHIADDIAGALNRITIEPTQVENTIKRTMRMNKAQMQKTSEDISSNMQETIQRARYMITGGRSRGQ